MLCPVLEAGSVIILDNASFHKSDEIIELAREYGCQIIFLPPYSPDLNPIEKVWANLKRYLRKCIKKFSQFREAITHAIRKTFSG